MSDSHVEIITLTVGENNMRISRYTYVKQFNEDLMLYNTKTGGSLIIYDVNTEVSKELLNNKLGTLKIDTYKELFEVLVDQEFIIHENMNELLEIKNLHHKHIKDDSVLDLTILPTTKCNFSCPYCFLYDKNKEVMDETCYDSILNLIKNFSSKTISNMKKRVIINWFGGEPTLRAADIIKFMEAVNEYAAKNNLEVFSTIVTNGYLLNEKMFMEMINVNITQFQVTVDGTKEHHDAHRYLSNGNGTYDQILQNLVDISNISADYNYQMSVRCNFTKSSIQYMNDFLEEYKKYFSNNFKFNIYFRPVYDYDTKENEIENMRSDLFSLSEGIETQNKFAISVLDKTDNDISRRMFDPLPMPTYSWCNADRDNHCIIGPDGKIFMCDTLTGDGNVVGLLNSEGNLLYNGNYTDWNYDIFNDSRTEKCVECNLLPLCYGSCRRVRISTSASCYWTEEIIYNSMELVYNSSN